MRPTGRRVFLALAVVACWLAHGARADQVDAAKTLGSAVATATAIDATTTSPRPGRIKAPDGRDRMQAADEDDRMQAADEDDRILTVTETANAATALKASTTATAHDDPSIGSAPVVVLVTGSIVIAVVALAFQKRRAARSTERDESDPMQQSLLFHDMDYAAM